MHQVALLEHAPFEPRTPPLSEDHGQQVERVHVVMGERGDMPRQHEVREFGRERHDALDHQRSAGEPQRGRGLQVGRPVHAHLAAGG